MSIYSPLNVFKNSDYHLLFVEGKKLSKVEINKKYLVYFDSQYKSL